MTVRGQLFGRLPTQSRCQSMRVAIEAGVRISSALAEWADWAQTVPPAAKPE
jgi:hypothetical protein